MAGSVSKEHAPFRPAAMGASVAKASQGEAGMEAQKAFKPLSRAQTMVPAPGGAAADADGGHVEAASFGAPLQRRAWTDVIDPKYLRSGFGSAQHRRYMNHMADEVLYRRHFHFQQLRRVPSLKGVRELKEDLASASSAAPASDDGGLVCVVDCFSTGAVVAAEAMRRGHRVVCILSGDMEGLEDMVPSELKGLGFAATFAADESRPFDGEVRRICDLIEEEQRRCGAPLLAVLAGAETGVALADAVSEALGLASNGTSLSTARRDKYVMGETIRAAGLRAVGQAKATTWPEVRAFLDGHYAALGDGAPCVIKPQNSAGSDDVFLCRSAAAVRDAFGAITGKRNQLGLVNEGVLVQEYLTGDEFVVDSVSWDGEHKCAALWVYDRRAANGGAFVCFGQHLLDADEHEAIISYAHRVLDALGIRFGPTHAEVKLTPTGPCLVEVGARCHGGEGLWCGIADEVWGRGTNQAAATVGCYTEGPAAFAALPQAPVESRRLAHGSIRYLICSEAGELAGFGAAAVAEIKAMASFRKLDLFKEAGDALSPTTNCFGWCGAVCLANSDAEALAADYRRIGELEAPGAGLFEFRPAAAAAEDGVVVVIDPFSTGALLAAGAEAAGRRVACVYSGKLSEMAFLESFIPAGIELSFCAVVAQDEADDTPERMRDATVGKLRGLFGGADGIRCVIPGAETGVALADAVSEALGLDTNGSALSEARRDKFAMGEAVRAAGLRAVQQAQASCWADAERFLAAYAEGAGGAQRRAVVKPMSSAGTDDVFLCDSAEQVREGLDAILGKKNKLGLVNDVALVQEYLTGDEFVVDSVSWDGEHKCAALWVYDRRAANGGAFVCFGQHLLDADEHEAIISYAHRVLDALGIRFGPTHAEVKLTPTGPCLVEVGARCHGGEGLWCSIADEVWGFNQASATVDAYVANAKWQALPARPLRAERRAHGTLKFLLCHQEGVLREWSPKAMAEVQAMASFRGIELFKKAGDELERTINLFGWTGAVKLVHKDKAVLEADYQRLEELETKGELYIF